MFVEAHTTLAMPADRAREAVELALEKRAGQHHSQGEDGDGLDMLLEVGPSRLPKHLAKTVQVRTLETRQVGQTAVIPLRWEATGVTARLYPSLDANLGITPSDEHTSVLSIIGSYTPPLGALGAGLDRAAMSRVAQGTVDAFLKELAAAAVAGCSAPSV